MVYVAAANGHTFSRPNCTLPPQELYHFVSAPNVRGTLDILWTCLATIIACTYTVLHLNVPEQRDGRDMDRGWRGDLKWWRKGIWPSLKWTVATVLAPEYYATIAIGQFLEARETLTKLRKLPDDRHPPYGWTLTHAFFVQMGGFAMKMKQHPEISSSSSSSSSDEEERHGSLAFLSADQLRTSLLSSTHHVVVPSLPTETEIQDRSKSDLFARALVVLQIAFFCLNCLTRAIRHLPLTLLELGTLGFAACTILTYIILFKKPRSVAHPIVLADLNAGSHRDFDLGAGALDTERTHNNHVPVLEREVCGVELNAIAMGGLAVLLGAIHVAGWDFAFPTAADRWAWRACAVASTVAIPALLVGVGALDATSLAGFWATWLLYAGLGAYCVMRVVLIAEMVRCLFYLPAAAYTTTWAANIPHVG